MTSGGGSRFGPWLRERLGTRTYGHVAAYVGVSTSTVSRWVTGESVPEYRNRLRLATYLDVPLAELEALLPAEGALDARAGYGSLESVPTADWLTDPDLRVMFYGINHDLTPEELASIRPILWKEYLAILARRRGGGDARGGAVGPGAPP